MDDIWKITLRGIEFKLDEQDGELQVTDFNTGESKSMYNVITRVEDVPGFARGWVRAVENQRKKGDV
jgi:hypothetical protein